MQKKFLLEEIRKICVNTNLTIMSENETNVIAMNTRNGMQHIFYVRQPQPEDFIMTTEEKKRIIEDVEMDEQAEKEMKQIAQNEKEKIMQSFKALHNLEEDVSDNDEFIIDGTFDAEITKFAEEPAIKPLPVIEEKTIEEKPTRTRKTTGSKKTTGAKPKKTSATTKRAPGRPAGAKNKPKQPKK